MIDLQGKRFGRLTVIGIDGRAADRQILWKCQCECGNIITVPGCSLRNGTTRSCGCYRHDTLKAFKRKPIDYDIDRSTAICYTSSGEEFYIDAEDIQKIEGQSWYIGKNGYVYGRDATKGKPILLHRYLLDLHDRSIFVDHIDRNPLNNRKSNLRVCTIKENQFNIGIRANNTSGYTGVTWDSSRSKWAVTINVHGKAIHLGRYDKYKDAINARFEAEKKYWGDFAPFDEQYIENLIN